MICKNLLRRSKKNEYYFFCKTKKKKINLDECRGCELKEFKEYKKLSSKPIKEYKLKKHKITKMTEIPIEVKKEVWERDKHKCIFCGKAVPLFNANSHFIKRSKLGLGIPENIMTNCDRCHDLFDNSIKRKEMIEVARKYFMSKYKNWDEKKLIYKKWGE